MRPRSFVPLLLLVLANHAGCNSLPPGDVRHIGFAPGRVPSPVVLIRGWRDLWSDGIDGLADELRATGIDAAVFKESQARDVGDSLVVDARAGRAAGPVILVGFSYGADDVIQIAQRLNDAGRAVDLLVLIDPVTPGPIPTSVRRCVNYYQSNGVWDTFPWLRGVPARVADGTPSERLTNIDIRSRADLVEAGTSHKTMAGNAKLHAAILAEVARVARGDGTATKP
jgi:pimeloyl-ACP methyl ester carboxylesterase